MTFDERAARAALIKQTRRGIMDCLDRVYPVPFSGESIEYALLYLDVGADVLRKDLAYLCDKGLIRWSNAPTRGHLDWDQRTYVLTPAGKEFVDGMSSDPALMP